MKIPFDIKYRPQIESGEYKVETRDGKTARIVCWDRINELEQPIVALVQYTPDYENIISVHTDGIYDGSYGHVYDLFIITPEPELNEFENDDEKIRKEMIFYFQEEIPLCSIQEHADKMKEFVAWLENKKERKPIKDVIKSITENKETATKFLKSAGIMDDNSKLAEIYRSEKNPTSKYKIGDTIYFNSFGKIVSMVVDNIIDTGDGNPMYEDADGSCVFEKDIIEQKPSESDTIKGGDFISDGKRVFLVLANVKERNLGETSSTFCEGRILGVDGVVYCDGDDFKEFKRATSDERAKFIHDLKVGIELKEHPAEWSDEDEKCIKDIINCLEYLKREDTERQYNGDRSVNPWRYEDMIAKLKSFRTQPHWRPSEEQMKILRKYVMGEWRDLTIGQDKILTSLYIDLQKLL